MLQEFNEDNFPLEKYIVEVNKDVAPPSYLSKLSTYRISNGLPKIDPKFKMSSVQMLNMGQWPPCAKFKLDESQFNAFRAALTKQMVIIQGPPGKIVMHLFCFHSIL